MYSIFYRAVTSAFVCCLSFNLYADASHHGLGASYGSDGLNAINADSHAPIGVMGDHMHGKGEWMLSYRYMYMEMEGNRIGTDSVSPEFIVANSINRFGMPPTLRVVPTKMDMHMHMFGAMYAPTDWLTLMVMGMYQEKEMDHVTFNPMGTARIGTFTTEAKGLGDTKVSGLFRLYNSNNHKLHLNAGISLPTGSNKKRDTVLAPTGMTPNLRLPYPMQLGSGTYDLLPGITYSGYQDQIAWGAQYMANFRTGRDQGYTLGDKHDITAWASYRWRPWVSNSVRLAYSHTGKISGSDPQIAAPVQTAHREYQGGEVVTLFLGINLVGQQGKIRGHRLALEAGIPLHRDLNGPQLETDLTITGGWQYAF